MRPLRNLCAHAGRLHDALILTLTGCWSYRWQSGIICYAAAAEALLTYSTKPGITKRLSTSYACLVEAENSSRDHACREFLSLYSSRSNIMHGRTKNIVPAERLKVLVGFQDALRKLWQQVLRSQNLMDCLEGTDEQREAHFRALESGYTPPK